MEPTVREDRRNGVAILTLHWPPSNALVPALRADLLEKLKAACADPAVRGIVLTGAGRGFSQGLDLSELGAPASRPPMGDLCNAVEVCDKPVIAALHGAAAGAAVSLSLAAHGRVAQQGARLSLPEIRLDMVPGDGATQRLPRLLGAQAAIELMLSGRAAGVDDPRLTQMFDRVVADDPIAAAVELALQMAGTGEWMRTRDRVRGLSDPEAYQTSVADVRLVLQDKDTAGADIVACIEAAQLLPFEQGLAFEAERVQQRAARPEAAGLRHIVIAERRAAMVPKPDAAEVSAIADVALLGCSPLAADLAVLCVSHGLPVQALAGGAADETTLLQRVQNRLDRAVQVGRIGQHARDRRLARLSTLRGPDGLAGAGLVLDTGEPGFEHPPGLGKGGIWVLVNDTVPAGERALEIGAGSRRLRMRLHRPGAAGQLLELALPDGADPGLAATMVRTFSNAGCSVIWCDEAAGYPGDTLAAALHCAALVMLAAGVPPSEIEAGAHDLGFARGPLRMIDEAGAFATLARLRRACDRAGMPLGPLRLLSDRIADAGANPARALAFHRPAGQALQPDPGLAAWLTEWREDNPQRAGAWPGIAPATALHAALVNEAARRIAAGSLSHAGDADLVAVKGLGFARNRGGPLLRADQVGLLGIVRAMGELQGVNAALWTPQPHLSDMLKNGRRFF